MSTKKILFFITMTGIVLVLQGVISVYYNDQEDTEGRTITHRELSIIQGDDLTDWLRWLYILDPGTPLWTQNDHLKNHVSSFRALGEPLRLVAVAPLTFVDVKNDAADCACSGTSTANKEATKVPNYLENTFVDPVQSQRRKNMLKECQTLGKNYAGTLPEPQMKRHMIYDVKTNLVFCDIPKVGSTFLKQVLHIVYGHRHVKDPFSIKASAAHTIPFNTFVSIPYDKALAVLMNSTKFMFVRHPYTRMLSGYVDKLYTNNFVFWGSHGKTILKNHRQHVSKQSRECGHDSTFPEFIKHVIKSEISGTNRNPHWYPMYDACRPCSLQYDVIGKIETFKEDIEKILRRQHLDEIIDISKMNEGNENEAISLTVNRAYDVIIHKPKCVSLPQALERAWKVLQIRGVLSHLSDFPYNMIKKNSNITKSSFKDFIVKEMKRLPMTKSDKDLSREQAVVVAYESVPSGDLEKFNSIFHPDFTLYGYEKNIGTKHKNFLKWEPFKLRL
ncbi:carbohydrate sulfotransferase 13-like [Ylistrum balloti]|uniref:carbohydrate sulfotransferase 13-like n=1 Tax=Ylistrum balloti TaxID=509963 RepID=UPI002905A3B1|nr:carbohydrate sulfotransferase 13-like [Ylistrum balloti]